VSAQVPFIRIAKTGDPVPGMPGFTWDTIGTPAIDGQGNIAMRSRMDGPGIGGLNDDAIFYGRPGNISMIFRESDPVPRFGDGVVQRSLTQPVMAQTGEIGYEAKLNGPGITSANDDILWAGAPSSLQVVARQGDTPPGVNDGSVYDSPFGIAMGHGGHVAFSADILPPGGAEYSGLWSGSPASPRLVTRTGDHAPGTEPGVHFSLSFLTPGFTVNRRGAVAFPAPIDGPGVNATNNAGIWAGTADDLGLVMRAGDPAQLPETSARFVGEPPYALINGNDRVLFSAFVTGDDITATNDYGLWAGSTSGAPRLIAREDDEVPLLGPDFTITDIFPFIQTEDDRVIAVETFDGPGTTPENDQAIFFGEPADWNLLFREGDQAPGLPNGVVFEFTNRSIQIAIVESGAAGMLLGVTGAGVTEMNDEALFWRRSELDPWQMVAREGELFDGSIIRDGGLDITVSGGGDGARPSINDRGDLAFTVQFEGEFPNTMNGAYVVPSPGARLLLGIGLVQILSRRRRSSG
jgi:hypothetical protein